MVYIKEDKSILSVSSVAHCARKEKALTGLKQYGLFARTEFYQFVFMQNGQWTTTRRMWESWMYRAPCCLASSGPAA